MTELARLTLLRGDDLTRVQVLLAEIKASLGDPQMADMNTTLLESETLNLESLRADCLTMPFLAERRLVLVSKARQILTKLNPSEREKLLDILANLPDTAALVLVIEDSQSTKRGKVLENARAYAGCLTGSMGKRPGAFSIVPTRRSGNAPVAAFARNRRGIPR